MSHTPGPWYMQVSENKDGELTTDINSRHGGYIVCCDVDNDDNARLIAAAPEMLEMLKKIEEIEGELDCWDHKEMRALIVKVEGEI